MVAVANAVNPADIISNPAPIPNVARPNKANAAAKPRIDGINGANTKPAIPTTANAPANAIKPFAISSQDKLPRDFITGAMIDKAPAAIRSAADPARVPFMAIRASESNSRDPAITVSPLPISSQLIPPNSFTDLAKTSIAALTINNPVPIPIIFLGIKYNAAPTSIKATPMAVRPRVN